MLFDTAQFVLFCVAMLLLAVIAYRFNAYQASLPKPMPKNPLGFQG